MRSEITIRPKNEFLVYIRRQSPPGVEFSSSTSAFLPEPTEWEATATVKEWNSRQRASALMVYYAEAPDTVALREAVACGPWEAVSVSDLKTKATRDLGRGIMALWSEPRYEQGALRFDVMHNADRELHDLRMVARRRSGGDEKLLFHSGVITGSPTKGFALIRGTEAEAKARLHQVKDGLLATMKDRVAAIQKEAGVSRLVSKWDEETLKAHSQAKQVDVTDLFLRDYPLKEKQRKTVEAMRGVKPLPLKEAEKMLREGKL